MSSIIPGGFSGGYTLPGSNMFPMGHLGATNHLETTSLYNPLGGNPILQAGNTSLTMGNPGLSMGAQNTQLGNQSMGMEGDESQQMPLTTPRLYAPPTIKVVESCESVKTQAVKISNKVMEL